MFLARIIGDVVSDHKIKDYVGLKMLVVQPIDPEGQALGNSLLAVDNVHAGVGDTVLIMDEGGSARMLLEEPDIFTIRTVVAGIVDDIKRDVNK